MTVEKRECLYRGKAKSLYATSDPDLLISEFRNDTTAFDGVKHEQLEDKGAVNRQISGMVMDVLAKANIRTHLVRHLSETEDLVKKLRMVPLESVIRNVAAGSLCRRLGVAEKQPLNPPLFEFFYKSDELHDPLVTEDHALAFAWATQSEMDEMRALTYKINDVLKPLFDKAGLILVDAKFEFGVDSEGQITLGDEISPDACRIWDKVTQKVLDKDRFRKDMGNVVDAYKEIAERLQSVIR